MTAPSLTRTRFAQAPIELMEACATRKGNLFVYLWLWHYAGRDDAAWPSVDRVASECHMKPDDVRAAIRWLADQGWLIRIDRPGRTTLYRVRIERTSTQETTPPPNGGSPKQGTTPLPQTGDHTPPPFGGDEQEDMNKRTRTRKEEPLPQRSAAKGPRSSGTNPRAAGTNPRATGTNLRAKGTNPRNGGVVLSVSDVPDDLAPVADLFADWWNHHKKATKAQKTERALAGQITQLRKIRDDRNGGMAAVKAQIERAIECANDEAPWIAIKHERWAAYSLPRTARQTVTASTVPQQYTPIPEEFRTTALDDAIRAWHP